VSWRRDLAIDFGVVKMRKVTLTMTASISWLPGREPSEQEIGERLLPTLEQTFRDQLHGVENTGVLHGATKSTIKLS